MAYGVKVTGATVHYVNEIPDGGEIILQKAVEIEEGDTPEVLQRTSYGAGGMDSSSEGSGNGGSKTAERTVDKHECI